MQSTGLMSTELEQPRDLQSPLGLQEDGTGHSVLRYLLSLALTVVVVTSLAASMQFAQNSHVLSGKAVDETFNYEFTIDAGDDEYYEINPELVEFLETGIAVYTEGAPHIVTEKTEITPKKVSWSEGRTNYTATGAAMTIHLHWDTPANSANGSRGVIYMGFPEIPDLQGKPITLHSGPYQKDNKGRYAIREVTTYGSPFQLGLARFIFALAAGLPFGILLHTIGWGFVVWSEKRSRLAQLPPRNAGLPQTFYTNPIEEWIVWLFILGLGAAIGSMIAGFSIIDGFMGSGLGLFIYCTLGIGVVLAALRTWYVSKSVLTLRVGAEAFSYARGRENPQWSSAIWGEILTVRQMSRTHRGRTTYWLEVEFKDDRKMLKISRSIVDYPKLSSLLAKMAP
jgi:hypothetical protein